MEELRKIINNIKNTNNIIINEVTNEKLDYNVSSKKLYSVFDLEFYGVKPQHKYGNLKQIAFILFDENYNIIEIFDETFINEGNQHDYILKKVDNIMSKADINFAWGCHQDLRTMYEFGFNLSNYTIVDMQLPFQYHNKHNTLGGTYYKLTGERIVGAHNALIDAKYTFKIIEFFDLARPGGVDQLEKYAKYLLKGDRESKDLNGLSIEDRQMLKQLGIFINSKCKKDAYAQLDKVSVMLNERVDEGIINEAFANEKRKYYKSRIKDIK